MSAMGNDYGYEEIFSRELEAIGSEHDVFIPISTSGNSPNIIKAVEQAIEKRMYTCGLTGQSGGRLGKLCDTIRVPSTATPRIQESHILIGHIICELVEAACFKN
jgi:D-sedoheptulose 7-phosphate isomerase